MSAQNPKRGFTLVELMVVVAIIAVIASVGMVTFNQSQKLARDAKRKQDLRSIAIAIEIYYQKFGHYPCTDGTVAVGWQNSASGNWLTNITSAAAICGDATHAFNTNYINKIPYDPLHPSTTIKYWFNTRGDGYATCSTSQGLTYILAAVLENKNDPEGHYKKPFSICGTTLGEMASDTTNNTTFYLSSH